MSITRKFVAAIVGAITALAGMALALLPAVAPADSPGHSPETDTSRIANSPGENQISSDFPWN